MKLAELPQVLALTPAEKLDLIDQLWESMELQQIEVSPQEKQLLNDRWAEHLADPSKALTVEQFKEVLDKRLK